MRVIEAKTISKVTSELAIKANTDLRPDVLRALKKSLRVEKSKLARNALNMIIHNAQIAREKKLAICQDTGLPVVFVDLGEKVLVKGNLYEAIQKGIRDGYKKAHFRESIILDPFRRKLKCGFVPAIVNIRIVKGARLTLAVLPKGFGSENKSALKLFNPTAGPQSIIDWIIEAVKAAGAQACPPFVLGVGIGGTTDEAGRLAKHALLRPIQKRNKEKFLASLEKKILTKVNNLGIGPFGLGGETSALGVNIQTAPTHIAGLPVALNISCHALRSAWAAL